MKLLIISVLANFLCLQFAFAEIPEGKKEYECAAESEKGILDALVLVQSKSNEKGDIVIQYAYSRQEAVDNFLKAIAPKHYVLGNTISILSKDSDKLIKDKITFLDCEEIK